MTYIEKVLKDFEKEFMNNGVNGVLDDKFQDAKVLIMRSFLRTSLLNLLSEIEQKMPREKGGNPELETNQDFGYNQYREEVLAILKELKVCHTKNKQRKKN